jgi:hypothetical protein
MSLEFALSAVTVTSIFPTYAREGREALPGVY